MLNSRASKLSQIARLSIRIKSRQVSLSMFYIFPNFSLPIEWRGERRESFHTCFNGQSYEMGGFYQESTCFFQRAFFQNFLRKIFTSNNTFFIIIYNILPCIENSFQARQYKFLYAWNSKKWKFGAYQLCWVLMAPLFSEDLISTEFRIVFNSLILCVKCCHKRKNHST